MKTATITFHWTKSFGAVLQAYSLQNFILEHGFENKVIDYSGNRAGSFRLYSKSKKPKALISNIDIALHKKSVVCGNNRFIAFITNRIIKTEPYDSVQQLKDNPPMVDVYITGSDQVWSVGGGIGEAYFLNFGNEDIKRISYAASMGKSVIAEEHRETIKKYLGKFSAISVREHALKEAITPLVNCDIEENIDPVFLTSAKHWRTLQHKVSGMDKPYILCFCIYRPHWLNGELKKLHKVTGKDIVIIEPSSLRNIYHNNQIRDAGPEEFLWLIDNADAVITTSFHGVAFSMIFQKPLYAIVNPDAPERISNLLNLLGADKTIVDRLDVTPPKYDSNTVKMKIAEQIRRSEHYLLRCFEEYKR
jgi:hypothetical protein